MYRIWIVCKYSIECFSVTEQQKGILRSIRNLENWQESESISLFAVILEFLGTQKIPYGTEDPERSNTRLTANNQHDNLDHTPIFKRTDKT